MRGDNTRLTLQLQGVEAVVEIEKRWPCCERYHRRGARMGSCAPRLNQDDSQRGATYTGFNATTRLPIQPDPGAGARRSSIRTM
jgi:hypothetical protein